jgi:hypothetical protein
LRHLLARPARRSGATEQDGEQQVEKKLAEAVREVATEDAESAYVHIRATAQGVRRIRRTPKGMA